MTVRLLLPLAVLMLSWGTMIAEENYPFEETVFTRTTFNITIYGDYSGDVDVIGRSDLGWSEPYFDGMDWLIDTEVLSMDLYGDDEMIGPVAVRTEPSMVSGGQVLLGPGGDYPAESFFNLYVNVLIPELFPGDTLHNVVSIDIVGTIDAMPPYFDDYEAYMPSPVVLFNQDSIPVGEIDYYRERCATYYEPAAHVSVVKSKDSDIAVPEDFTILFHAGLTGYLLPDYGNPTSLPIVPSSAVFSIREDGYPGPFTEFYTDFDGGGRKVSTTGPVGEGDGWCGYLDISSYPTLGSYYEVEVNFSMPQLGQLRDTLVTYIDPTPPIPEFIMILPESIAVFKPDSLFDIVFTTGDEDAVNGDLLVFKLEERKERLLTSVEQHLLEALGDTAAYACLPAAAASCLDYWANNGYPDLAKESGNEDHKQIAGKQVSGSGLGNGGDEKPPMDPNDMAEELAGAMGTDTTGTDALNGANGIAEYLRDRGHDDWYVAWAKVDDASGIGWLLEEFDDCDQDVIMVVYDTTAAHDDTTGHAVTLGSHASGSNADPDTVDFMNPEDGMSGSFHEYAVEYDEAGHPRLTGYNLDGDGSATVTSFIEVSPPEEEEFGKRLKAAPGASQFTPGEWNLVDSGPVCGSGVSDTLVWNTTGFPEGTYLLVIRVMDGEGYIGRNLRLADMRDVVTDIGNLEIEKVETALGRSYPNPFNPTTTIEFTLANRTDVSLSIYDVSGRLVRRLLIDEPKAAGVHRIGWNALNDEGKRLASGVYFCRLETREFSDEIKIILIK